MMSTVASLPSVMKPRLNRTSRRKPNFRRWCLLASWHSGQGRQINCLSACLPPAATWNLHTMIRLKRIYNFWCSMLVFTPFAYCFVTLRGTFMHFPELTY
jgi:hypothetical protein